MPPNYRPRISPSGPFQPGAGELEGFVRRAWDMTNDAQVTVPEGGAWTNLVEVPVPLAASDQPISELSWIVEAWANFTIQQPESEQPQTFPCSIVLACESAAGPVGTPIVKEVASWPWNTDDANLTYNNGYARFIFDPTAFAFAEGTNYFRVQLAFFGGGAHSAIIAAADARLSVVEMQGPAVVYI